MILLPWLYGLTVTMILYGNKSDKGEHSVADHLLTGWIMVIGLAEAAHVGAIFLGRSFSGCINLLKLAVCGLAAVCVVILLFLRKRLVCFWKQKWENIKEMKMAPSEKVLMGVFVLLVLSQAARILIGLSVYRGGDMTLETIQAFLQTDAIYSVNPLTGMPYVQGIPLRLQILCLPTLYGFFGNLFGCAPEVIVWKLIPIVMLVLAYLAYGILGKVLFPKERTKRLWFMTVVALLFWVSDSMFGLEGFGLLHCGYRGVTIRGAVLLPYVVGLVLRKRWVGVVLCILAEACIVWTLYGLGVCFMVAAHMA